MDTVASFKKRGEIPKKRAVVPSKVGIARNLPAKKREAIPTKPNEATVSIHTQGPSICLKAVASTCSPEIGEC